MRISKSEPTDIALTTIFQFLWKKILKMRFSTSPVLCAPVYALFEVNGGFQIKGKTMEERNAY
jgi:hypothetical protein